MHGYPPKLKNNSWRKDNKVASNVSNAECGHQENNSVPSESKLTDEEVGQLLSLLNKQNAQNEIKEPSVSNTAHLAGKPCSNVQKNVNWIIDSGASDHICLDVFYQLSKG